MQVTSLFLMIVGLGLLAFFLSFQRSARYNGPTRLRSLPHHYASLTAVWTVFPALLLMIVWSIIEPSYLQQKIEASLTTEIADQSSDAIGLYLNRVHLAIASGTVDADPVVQSLVVAYEKAALQSRYLNTAMVLVLCLGGITLGLSKILFKVHARVGIERLLKAFLILCSGVAIVTTIGIVLSVLFESIRFFNAVSVFDFMFGTSWSPQTSIRSDQVGSSGSFGAVPLFLGTLLISLIAMVIAVPVGLMTAIYLSEYATGKFRTIAKPTLEVLAGIPTRCLWFFLRH